MNVACLILGLVSILLGLHLIHPGLTFIVIGLILLTLYGTLEHYKGVPHE
jgi:hypothetical protein